MAGLSYLQMEKAINKANVGLRLDQLKTLLERNAVLDSELQAARKRIAELEAEAVELKVEGLRLYAWWQDGVEMVGTCGTTFKEAAKRIRDGEL